MKKKKCFRQYEKLEENKKFMFFMIIMIFSSQFGEREKRRYFKTKV
jgi:hypothetical protein